jgi:hypothetical protein
VLYASAAPCTQRTLRVWRVFPPLKVSLARSISSTFETRWRADIAATSAALPPPITTTSKRPERSTPGARVVALLGLTGECSTRCR